MNRNLARTIVGIFRDDAQPHPTSFAIYSERDWRNTKTWLDSSGMALYFLERLKKLHLEDSIPKAILAELEQNQADRKIEVTQRLEYFADLLRLLQEEKIRFAVEKGIALVPDYCPDVCFRFQVDFDFLVDSEDVQRCHELLLRMGYRYVPTIATERKFSKGDLRIPSIHDFYKPKRRHTVELHFDDSEETRSKLISAVPHEVSSLVFPVLSKADCFVEYVLHFVKHLRGGWVRTDALIEYRRFVTSVERDREFWIEVQRRYDTNGGVREAMAIMALMAESVLGVGIAPELMVAVDVMPSGVRCWVEQYAWKVVLAEYPGTKLYIILELALGQRGWLSCARMIFPSAYRPSRIAEADGTPAAKRRAQSLFFVTRLRYHIYESVPTLYELLAWRWAGARSSEGSSA